MPILASVLAAVVVTCGEPTPPSPTESPPTAPTIRLGDWQATDGRWTFTATVNPRGSPTDVVLEYGFGPETAPAFDTIVSIEEDLLDARAVSATVEVGEDREFCARFTATNEIGSVSTDARCHEPFPSGVVVVPGPGDSASP